MARSIHTFGYRSPRFRTDFHLLLQSEDHQGGFLDGRCIDISEDGLGAQFRALLEVGTKVSLILTLPESAASLRLAARVTNRTGDIHGFAFIFSSQQEMERVRRYVQSLQGKKGSGQK